jgi:DNA-binding NtrC family response regulator
MEPTRLQPCDANSSTRTTRRHDAEAAPPLGQGRPAQNEPAVADGILGRSPAFVSLLRGLVEVAAFTTASILLLGESGTGKEQLGRLVHALDPRAGKRELVTLDCTTVAPELAPSEFFGHERGAFTGAVAARDGAFHRADGGTLFLDEVGELPLPLEAQLLRIVQEGTYKRVGGNDWLATRFRLVAATNRSLADEVERERFRLDFFHRLTTWTFRGPPLRERPEDIVPLARHFARQSAGPGGAPDIDERVQQFLIRRAYPGNVRELKQLIGRICSRHVAPGPITIGDVPPEDLAGLELAGEILHESRRRSGRAAWSCRSRARSRAIRRRGRFESVSASTTPATNRAGWNACKASARARANSLVPRPRPLTGGRRRVTRASAAGARCVQLCGRLRRPLQLPGCQLMSTKSWEVQLSFLAALRSTHKNTNEAPRSSSTVEASTWSGWALTGWSRRTPSSALRRAIIVARLPVVRALWSQRVEGDRGGPARAAMEPLLHIIEAMPGASSIRRRKRDIRARWRLKVTSFASGYGVASSRASGGAALEPFERALSYAR